MKTIKSSLVLFTIIAVLILSAEIVLAVNFVGTSGRNFVVGTDVWRPHIGVNSRGLAHYGTAALPYATIEDQHTQLAAARDMGVRVIRFFAANRYLTHTEATARVKAIVDKAYHVYGIYSLVVFTDFYNTPFHPPGDDVYYERDLNNFIVLNQEFFESGFRNNYIPFVRTLVAELKDHPGVFSWQIGNELKTATFGDSNPQTLVDFVNEVVNEIRLINTNHLIGSGIISAANAALTDDQARQLYQNLSYISNHNYDQSNNLDNDLWLAVEQDRPHIISEAGFPGGAHADRGNDVDADINDWFNVRGSQGYYQWGFLATDNDNGDGDRSVGMDRIWHNDWDSLFFVYQKHAGALPPANPELVNPEFGAGD